MLVRRVSDSRFRPIDRRRRVQCDGEKNGVARVRSEFRYFGGAFAAVSFFGAAFEILKFPPLVCTVLLSVCGLCHSRACVCVSGFRHLFGA